MTTRIPPSLSWLIKKRSYLLGELIDAEKKLSAHIKQEEARIKKIKANLRSLDGTIKLHEIKLDPTVIEPTRPTFKNKFLPHGGYTKLVFEVLRAAHPNPVSTEHIASRLVELVGDQVTFARAIDIIRYRMKDLSRQGYLTSVHLDKSMRLSRPGLWTLNTDRVQNTKKLVNRNLPATLLALTVAEPPA